MFSLFENGITDTKCSKFLSLDDLIRIIRNNPNSDRIETIRKLRKVGDESYKVLKSELPNITPSCVIKERNLNDDKFDQNFFQFSHYLYFDIDTSNVEEYKNYFIQTYGNSASLICLSVSGGGISVLFKVGITITKDNFQEVWQNVRETLLSREPIDPRCTGIGRAMFISHDPNVFYNYENEIEVNLKNPVVIPDKKRGKQSKTCKDFNNRLNSPFLQLSLDEVLQKLVRKTIVDVINPIVDFKPADYVEVFIPESIKDGTKHTIYTRMIHTLVYLNPNIEKEYILKFLFYVNNRFAKPKMVNKELVRLFNLVYNGIKETGETYINKEKKFIHFNSKHNLSKEEKIQISNFLNGCKRKNGSIQKIIEAKKELELKGQRVTKKRISEISGLSPKTVRAHINSPLINMDDIVGMINDSMPGDVGINEVTNSNYDPREGENIVITENMITPSSEVNSEIIKNSNSVDETHRQKIQREKKISVN